MLENFDIGFRRQYLLDQLVNAAGKGGVFLHHDHGFPTHVLGQHVLAEIDIEHGQGKVAGDIHKVHFVLVVILDDLVDDADEGGPGIERRRAVFGHALKPAERDIIDAARNNEIDILDFVEIFVSADTLGHIFAGIGLDELDHAPAEHTAGGIEFLDGNLGSAQRAFTGIGIERADESHLDRIGGRSGLRGEKGPRRCDCNERSH